MYNKLCLISINFAKEKGAGFASDTNHVYIYSKGGSMQEFGKDTKYRISQKIIDHIITNEENK